MTPMDLLRRIGEVDDKYIMESRKSKHVRRVWPAVLAAVLALAIIGTGVKYLDFHSGSSVATESDEAAGAALEAAPAEGAADTTADDETVAEIAEEAAPAQTETAPVSAYDVTLLSAAQYPESLAYDDTQGNSERWKNNQVSDETATLLNTFAYRTAARLLTDQDTSGCYSPLSLYHTLSLLASGASGETRTQIMNLLGATDLTTLAEENGKLYRVNYKDNEINILKIFNSLWLDDAAPDGSPVTFNQEWVMSAATDYYADVYSADFSSPDTGRAMGAWIAEKTGGLIHPLLEPDESTIMSLVNTLWYKTQWMDHFNEDNNTTDLFYPESGDAVSTEYMHKADDMGSVVLGEGYIKSYLPLDTGRMVFVLPDEGTDIDSLLTEDRLWEIFETGSYENAHVDWSIPKFETTASYDLIPAMEQLGVTNAFDLVSADFSNMATCNEPVYLGLLQQDTHIVLSENGIEAAAFTIAAAYAGEGIPNEVLTIQMNLNRPFLYLITATDGSPLFIGVVRNPGA